MATVSGQTFLFCFISVTDKSMTLYIVMLTGTNFIYTGQVDRLKKGNENQLKLDCES